jgi:hypothetical protein
MLLPLEVFTRTNNPELQRKKNPAFGKAGFERVLLS